MFIKKLYAYNIMIKENDSIILYLSQFSDIYQEDHFITVLGADIRIVKELPVELRSLDLEAIGSLVSIYVPRYFV